MAGKKRERFREQKDFLQKNRNTIVYLIVLLALLGSLIGWKLLPEQVSVQVAGSGVDVIRRPKNVMLLVHLGMTGGFSALFWRWPREIAYFVGAIVSLLLVFNLLAANLGVA